MHLHNTLIIKMLLYSSDWGEHMAGNIVRDIDFDTLHSVGEFSYSHLYTLHCQHCIFINRI